MKKQRDPRVTPTGYVAVCKNVNEFCRETIWNINELVPPIKLDGAHLSRCPACYKPVTWMREENALPFDEEDFEDGEISQEAIQLRLFPKKIDAS